MRAALGSVMAHDAIWKTVEAPQAVCQTDSPWPGSLYAVSWRFEWLGLADCITSQATANHLVRVIVVTCDSWLNPDGFGRFADGVLCFWHYGWTCLRVGLREVAQTRCNE